jgi:hypothetical protein
VRRLGARIPRRVGGCGTRGGGSAAGDPRGLPRCLGELLCSARSIAVSVYQERDEGPASAVRMANVTARQCPPGDHAVFWPFQNTLSRENPEMSPTARAECRVYYDRAQNTWCHGAHHRLTKEGTGGERLPTLSKALSQVFTLTKRSAKL